jgi:hypothetical protein
MGAVEILVAGTKAEINEFIDLPWRLYSGSQNWVPPVKSHVRRLLDHRRHPFWNFAERVLFLARRGSRTVGRIAGIIDHHFIRYRGEETAKWGFFECEDDQEATAALLGAVEEWSRTKGMTAMHGPMNPSTNYDVGLLIEGFQYRPAVNMPYNPPYYAQLVESCGHTKEQDLNAFLWERGNVLSERVSRLARRANGNPAIRIRPMDKRNLLSEAILVKEIYEEAWSDNWGFVPMTRDEISEMASAMKWIGDQELSFFVYYNDRPVAVCLILLDINPLLKRLNGKIGISGLVKILLYRHEIKGARLVLFGIRKSHQRIQHAFPFVAIEHLHRLCSEKHEYVELGWILEENEATKQMAREIGARPYKRYRIFRKSFL